MPVFTFPWAFIALLAVPLLVAIYWLRSRAREHRVSSLLLWRDERQRWEGGRRIEKLQTPLLFWLELLAILLLIGAAAGPMLRAGAGGRPLVVVLDDSFSMLAGNDDSARRRAARALENELRGTRYEPVRLVLAGEAPQLLGEASSNAEQASRLLRDWACGSPTARLDEAIAFAFELGGARARVLAVTDRAPTQELRDSRLQWWAFGTARPNLAFINATRTTHGDEERVLLEVANLATTATATTITIESFDAANPQAAIRNPQSVALGAGETRRITLNLKSNAPLRARLNGDALDIDNEVVLLPATNKLVRVDLRVREPILRALVARALHASPGVALAADQAELIITDEAEANLESPAAWTLRIIAQPEAVSLLGPFVVDRAHPLTAGLSLGGVVWGSGRGQQLDGTPIITAGNIPLLTDVERAGRHELRLRLRPDLSTLQETPNWPILIWNLINWRASVAPGLRQANVRLGGAATLTTEAGVASVTVTDPQRNARQLPVRDQTVTIKADRAGIYELNAEQNKYAFAANALERAESDLSQAAAGRWGNWANAPELQREYRNVAWALLLLALIALALHGWLVAHKATSQRGR